MIRISYLIALHVDADLLGFLSLLKIVILIAFNYLINVFAGGLMFLIQ